MVYILNFFIIAVGIDYRKTTKRGVSPNFIAEIRSNSDTAEAVHRKMCLYMDAGVEVLMMMMIVIR